ncbi:MAG: hypothetical protein IID39_08405 [Planctomycetes bacterium]|nr:hypothetical protein [Planctomycetota bacterium]
MSEPAHELLKIPLELPMFVLVIVYAYRKQLLSGLIWRLYGLFYLGWICWEFNQAFSVLALEQLFLNAPEGTDPVPYGASVFYFSLSLGFGIMAPIFVLIWRLWRSTPFVDAQEERVLE